MRLFLFTLSLFAAVHLLAQPPERVLQTGHNLGVDADLIKTIVPKAQQYIVTYDQGGQFKLWDVHTKRLIREMDVHTPVELACEALPYFSRPTLSGDNNHLVTQASDNPFAWCIWNTNTGKV